jgi:hypothetical protein
VVEYLPSMTKSSLGSKSNSEKNSRKIKNRDLIFFEYITRREIGESSLKMSYLSISEQVSECCCNQVRWTNELPTAVRIHSQPDSMNVW